MTVILLMTRWKSGFTLNMKMTKIGWYWQYLCNMTKHGVVDDHIDGGDDGQNGHDDDDAGDDDDDDHDDGDDGDTSGPWGR